MSRQDEGARRTNDGSKSSHNTRRNRLERHFTGVVVETNLELVEHSGSAEKIKSNTEPLRETDRRRNLRAADFGLEDRE